MEISQTQKYKLILAGCAVALTLTMIFLKDNPLLEWMAGVIGIVLFVLLVRFATSGLLFKYLMDDSKPSDKNLVLQSHIRYGIFLVIACSAVIYNAAPPHPSRLPQFQNNWDGGLLLGIILLIVGLLAITINYHEVVSKIGRKSFNRNFSEEEDRLKIRKYLRK